jgi:hypothetical protein
MDVIGHNHPSVQLVPAFLAFSVPDCVGKKFGNPWIFQPSWAGGCVESAICRQERLAGRGVAIVDGARGERSKKTPGEKYPDIVWLDIG